MTDGSPMLEGDHQQTRSHLAPLGCRMTRDPDFFSPRYPGQMTRDGSQMMTGGGQMMGDGSQMMTGGGQMMTGGGQMMTGGGQMMGNGGQMLTGGGQMFEGTVR